MSVNLRQPDETLLLLTLGEVSELVSHCSDLSSTLEHIVRHIQGRFGTDVCSVYAVDRATKDLVLRATVGLRHESINLVRMKHSEGLTGLVAERMSPVAVEDAPQHPRYRYFPESGEEAYKSFLGVPLIQGGVAQGVMVVQHRETRRYTTNEIRLLMAVAAQLAVLVANARLTEELRDAVQAQPIAPPPVLDRRFQRLPGIAASPGHALGRAVRFEPFDFASPDLILRPAGTVDEERDRLKSALEQGRRDIDLAAQHLAELLGDQFGPLMQAQRLMLEDSSVQKELIRAIENGASVEQAVVRVCEQYLKAFQKLDNPVFYERIYDIKDVFRRVLNRAIWLPSSSPDDESIVVVAHEVSLLELFHCDLHRLRGIVVERGGAHSHVAILARSLRIPMLTHVHHALEVVKDGDEVYVDATSAEVLINPDESHRAVCTKLLNSQSDDPVGQVYEPTPIRLETTVNLLPEVVRTVRNGASAVGLYRSEFLELANRSFPTEEEQFDVYRKIVRLLEGLPFTLRTLDLRAEKLYGVAMSGDAADLIWEWRLVHRLPHVQTLLRTQLRATLRAAHEGPVRILFPMIASQEQLDCALQLLQDARQSLAEDGLRHHPNVPVGLMIETPSGAFMARRWIRRADFICIGSNDLLHSFLGVERFDDGLRQMVSPLDPSFLKTVRHVIKHAHALGRQVTVCGNAASDPRAILAFHALEADALSLPPDDFKVARKVFRERRMPADLQRVRRRIGTASSAQQVEDILTAEFLPVAPLEALRVG